MASIPSVFGTELRRRRVAAGLSLAGLGDMVHYNKSYLSKIENGLKTAPVDLARRCDVALGAHGALAALVPHSGSTGAPPAPDPDSGDDVWMLALAKDGMNHFMPTSWRALPAVDDALGFDIPYRDLAATDGATCPIFQSLFHDCVRLTEVVGPGAAMPTAIAQVHVLRNLAGNAPRTARERLLTLAGRYAEYVGWLTQQCGDNRGAQWWTSLAAGIADRAGNLDLAAFACTRQAEIALQEDDAIRGVVLAQHAQQDSRIRPRIRGFAALREAQGLALAGDYDGCQRALDKARASLDTDDCTQLGGLPVPPFGSSVPGGVTGWCMHDLGRLRDATAILDREVAFIPKSYRHATSRYQLRRVLAHAASGEVDHACALTGDLLDRAELVGSAVIRRDVRDLARTLSRWHTHRPVKDLYPRLTAFLHHGSASRPEHEGVAEEQAPPDPGTR